MKLQELIDQYIRYRRSLGEKFKTNETYLKAFCRMMGGNIEPSGISEEMINKFLYAGMPVTSGWFVKHTALKGFYNYAVSRGYIEKSVISQITPKRPPPFVPYIYSRHELKILFQGALSYQKNQSHVHPYMIRIILILIYATGLRLHEALSLKLSDVDLKESVITVEQSKFYKSRLVPFNQEILNIINEYLCWRKSHAYSEKLNVTLFVCKYDQALNGSTVEQVFLKIRKNTGIKRMDKANYQPRIHDLRHTFAVHRLTSWYVEKKDVQQLLPILSTYLGHQHLVHTSVYLTMTNDLLQEASVRFEQYATGENHEKR
ncbi:MAG: tyrosine-type recombinase/integrase [Gammaproteobacteria bacterium]|nr:tyrosine-type recombinase/integrase [Gammaproteobacteria bacterium]